MPLQLLFNSRLDLDASRRRAVAAAGDEHHHMPAVAVGRPMRRVVLHDLRHNALGIGGPLGVHIHCLKRNAPLVDALQDGIACLLLDARLHRCRCSSAIC